MVLVVLIIIFQNYQKFRSNIFLLWITHRGTPSGKGQSPVERPHSTPSPTPNHISSANIVTFGLYMPKAYQKNRPFGLWFMWFAWNQTCHITNDRCEALASLKGCFFYVFVSVPQYFSTEPFSYWCTSCTDLEIGDKDKGSRPPAGSGEAGLLYCVGKSLWIRWAIPRFASRRCRVLRLRP